MSNKLSYGQLIALNNTLTSYPDDLPFNQILVLIVRGSDEIDVQEDFAYWSETQLHRFILELAEDIDKGIYI